MLYLKPTKKLGRQTTFVRTNGVTTLVNEHSRNNRLHDYQNTTDRH